MSPPLPGWTESGSGTVIDLGRKLWAETTPPPPQREWSVGGVGGETTEITQDSEAGQLL